MPDAKFILIGEISRARASMPVWQHIIPVETRARWPSVALGTDPLPYMSIIVTHDGTMK